jgi:hypothetical protein
MYGLLKHGTPPIVETHVDISTLARSIGYHPRTVRRWLDEGGGYSYRDRFIITEWGDSIRSERGLSKGTDPRSLRVYE